MDGGQLDANIGKGSELEASAASIRADVGDFSVLLHALVDRLSAIPGLYVRVKYHQSKLSRLIGDLPYVNDIHKRSAPVQSIRVKILTTEHWIVADGAAITCGTSGLSANRGLVSTEIPFPLWIRGLIEAVGEQSKVNRESLAALESLIIDNEI